MSKEPRVLIIEDHEVLKVMLFTILRNQPLSVDTASTVDEAMARVATCDYALILIDMDLEGGGADSFLHRFAEQKPDATTFIIAVRDPRNEAFLDSNLVSAVLSKPLEINTLAEVVRECAAVVPPPADPLPCPPAESESDSPKHQTSYLAN
ncbi:MAG TPA: response regulator [Thermoanaerobaculia bacterium]|nr:response regulator [Thermoanaerobaculia bacterium]